MPGRVIYVFSKKYKSWQECQLKDMRDGDVFKIWDNGERYVSPVDGNNMWIVNGKPYKNGPNDGDWAVDTLY